MKVDKTKLIKYLAQINRQCGIYRGMLEGVLWWDIPKELKDNLKEHLEPETELKIDFLIDDDE